MNRTERAIKRSLKRTMHEKKREKRLALAEMRDTSWYGRDRKRKELSEKAREEKALKAWHRKIMNDYTRRNSSKEDAAA